uniref:Uncharacterized protein n=1 Tax=viral metagenome TaxID=1070528 RepID=A0A6C0LZ04_9ZZZZ
MTMQPAQHLSCDGCGIAKDDMRELERLDRKDELRNELFRNAARLHDAMRNNALLRPIFRKYKQVCREILNQKRSEAAELLALSEYCDTNDNNNHDMKLIRDELDHILSQIEQLHTQHLYEDTDEETDNTDDAEDTDNEMPELDDDDSNDDDDDDDDCSVASTSSSSCSSSSSSSSSYKKDLEDFM